MGPKATTLAIIEKDGKILLTKRNHDPFTGYWCLPGGHIEQDESAEDAIRREVKEETNLAFNGSFIGYTDEVFPEHKWHAVALVFAGTAEGEVKINEESTEYKWVSPEEAQNMELAFNHNDALRRKKWQKT